VSEAPPRPLCALIGALGGQGGGLLAEWLDAAAYHAGYPAQVTSIPGVAQRTGATTYYLELYPERDPPGEPVFSLFPAADECDLVIALEPTEAARALERGLVTARSTVITATARVYSTAEKVPVGDGRIETEGLLAALEASAAALYRVAGSGRQLNARVLGAIAATAVLPLGPEHCRAAIRARGVAVEANLAAFEEGLAGGTATAAEEGAPASRISPRSTAATADPSVLAGRTPSGRLEAGSATPSSPPSSPCAPPGQRRGALASRTGERSGLAFDPPPAALAGAVEAFPEPLRPIVGHALARLVDYQGVRYARRYLARLGPLVDRERRRGGEREGWRLSEEVARRLAAWMSYEDLARVAQLKTRPGRLARIRAELGASPDEPVAVRDYFKPGVAEIAAMLPRPLGEAIEGADTGEGSGGALRWPTSSPAGFALLRATAALRRLRPLTLGWAREQAAIERWLAAVGAALERDYELACATARLAAAVRGYGEVRSQGLARVAARLEGFEARLEADPAALRAQLEAEAPAHRD